jgi:hypothetical protein
MEHRSEAKALYAWPVTQSDRAISEKDRCTNCKGAGWTWFEAERDGRWIVCRECIGTGRVDQKGRKRLRPDEVEGA